MILCNCQISKRHFAQSIRIALASLRSFNDLFSNQLSYGVLSVIQLECRQSILVSRSHARNLIRFKSGKLQKSIDCHRPACRLSSRGCDWGRIFPSRREASETEARRAYGSIGLSPRKQRSPQPGNSQEREKPNYRGTLGRFIIGPPFSKPLVWSNPYSPAITRLFDLPIIGSGDHPHCVGKPVIRKGIASLGHFRLYLLNRDPTVRA
jgi:hypothetical protein